MTKHIDRSRTIEARTETNRRRQVRFVKDLDRRNSDKAIKELTR